ncbi:Pro-Pol polyprotein [Araneus ventricosus]|uniref:RNA-directed DNA polymerase n=1 Tax=Araneus ventricosus TaxID=182803 RepID=A0A4Y2IWH0_ARAVE|nr:Pro-Pol polyprotein [Araneus ventricosus]
MIGSNSDSDFFDKNEILYKYVDGRELIVVPRDMQTEIIKLAHEKGHFSAAKTEGVVKQEFFIPNLSKQVQNVTVNCVPCILTNKKSGKKDGFLNPIPKEDVPLSTYHVDFIGPLPSTNKKYQHILTIVDAFTKFTWLYPVKSTSAEDALDKLKVQQKTFGNPKRIITDRGSAFTSKAFGDYCTNENIQHFQITTGVPRGNGQVERIHRTLIPVLTKLSIADSTKWFKFVDPLQRILNSTFNRSTKWSPFELLIGVTMRNKEDLHLRDLLMEEMMEELQEQRDELRQDAKKNIQKIQAENKRTYDRKCRNAPSYQRGDLVVIQRTQFGTGLKLRPRFLGPYRIVKVKPRNRYDLEKVGGCQSSFCGLFIHGCIHSSAEDVLGSMSVPRTLVLGPESGGSLPEVLSQAEEEVSGSSQSCGYHPEGWGIPVMKTGFNADCAKIGGRRIIVPPMYLLLLLDQIPVNGNKVLVKQTYGNLKNPDKLSSVYSKNVLGKNTYGHLKNQCKLNSVYSNNALDNKTYGHLTSQCKLNIDYSNNALRKRSYGRLNNQYKLNSVYGNNVLEKKTYGHLKNQYKLNSVYSNKALGKKSQEHLSYLIIESRDCITSTDQCKLIIRADKTPAVEHERRFNAPTHNEVPIVMVVDESDGDIIFQKRGEGLKRIAETHRSYDSLQFSIIFCQGEDEYYFHLKQSHILD